MPKMFLIDVDGCKKQLLDENAALKMIENDFDKIKQITMLQESKMRYKVTLQNDKKFLVESAKIGAFIDKYFPIMEAFEEEEYEDWDDVVFYPEVYRADTGEKVWPNENTNEMETQPWSELSPAMETWISQKAEKLSKKLGLDCFAKIVDSEGLVAYTESEDDEVDDKYVEEIDIDDADDIDIEDEKIPEEKSLGEKLKQEYDNHKSAMLQKYEDARKMEGIGVETGDSMVDTLKGAYLQKCKRYLEAVNSIIDCETQIKRGEAKPEMYSQNIENNKRIASKAHEEMLKSEKALNDWIDDKKEEIATKTRRHEDLRQKQGLEWKKDVRMAANSPKISTGAFDALRQRLANKASEQNSEPSSNDQTL